MMMMILLGLPLLGSVACFLVWYRFLWRVSVTLRLVVRPAYWESAWNWSIYYASCSAPRYGLGGPVASSSSRLIVATRRQCRPGDTTMSPRPFDHRCTPPSYLFTSMLFNQPGDSLPALPRALFRERFSETLTQCHASVAAGGNRLQNRSLVAIDFACKDKHCD